MGVEISSFSELPVESIKQNFAEALQRLQEADPSLELRRGLLRDVLVYYGAVLQTNSTENAARLRRSGSLLEISQDPTLADDDIVDAALSNWGLSRREGTLAKGSVAVVVTENTTVTIASGAVFDAGGKQFTADQTYVAKSEESLVTAAGDRLMTLRTDGNYVFTIDVTAVDTGSAYRLRKNTLVVPERPPVNYLTSFAAGDFTDGLTTETNAELLARQQNGIAAKTLGGNRATYTAWLKDTTTHPTFASVRRVSQIGYGDPEQRRYHSIFPVAFGGRVDWYVRAASDALKTGLTKTATLVEITDDGFGIWQFGLDRDEAAGAYEVVAIRPTTDEAESGSFEIISALRSLSLGDDDEEFAPDLTSVEEAAFSRYQAFVVQFKDNQTSTSEMTLGDTQEYSVDIRRMPLIDSIQDEINAFSMRPGAHDVLVKAPIPVFVGLSCTVFKETTDEEPDQDAIKAAMAAAVNAVGFTGRLAASLLTQAASEALTGQMTLSAIDMLGRLLTPDDEITYLRSTELLQVSEDPENMTTARTVQFFCDAEDISINVETISSET